jgi:hypothetical protein
MYLKDVRRTLVKLTPENEQVENAHYYFNIGYVITVYNLYIMLRYANIKSSLNDVTHDT